MMEERSACRSLLHLLRELTRSSSLGRRGAAPATRRVADAPPQLNAGAFHLSLRTEGAPASNMLEADATSLGDTPDKKCGKLQLCEGLVI